MKPNCPTCNTPTRIHCPGPHCPWRHCHKCNTDTDRHGHTKTHDPFKQEGK